MAISGQFIAWREGFQRFVRQLCLQTRRYWEISGFDHMSAQIKLQNARLASLLEGRSIVLVGLMGAGKTCIGKRLAQKLNVEFTDADAEIEAAANCTIDEIFKRYGEQAFRDGERRVIARLLAKPGQIIATGGGAFADPKTRANIKYRGISVWLKAELDVLLQRVSRRNDRPLLKEGNKRAILKRLMDERYPSYAEADVTIGTANETPASTAQRTIQALRKHAGLIEKGSMR